jgi:hypothetical protein
MTTTLGYAGPRPQTRPQKQRHLAAHTALGKLMDAADTLRANTNDNQHHKFNADVERLARAAVAFAAVEERD